MMNYAAVNTETGLVENIVLWDGESEWSPGEGYEAIQSDIAQIGWAYANGEFTAPPPPPVPPLSTAEILARNTSMRDDLLAQAAIAIAPLQDAVDLDDATAAETALLTKWKQYRVAVNRIVLTLTDPFWPSQP